MDKNEGKEKGTKRTSTEVLFLLAFIVFLQVKETFGMKTANATANVPSISTEFLVYSLLHFSVFDDKPSKATVEGLKSVSKRGFLLSEAPQRRR